MPAPPPSVELAPRTKKQLAGEMDPHEESEMLSHCVCLVCNDHSFGTPVMVTASCQHHFHRHCIEPVLANKDSQCPCGAPIPAGKAPIIDAVMMKRMLNGVDVQCPLGCGGVMPFGKLAAHVHVACPKTPLRCGSEGCGEILTREEIEAHQRDCPHRLVPCGFCAVEVRACDKLRHEGSECAEREVLCEYCGGSYHHAAAQAHSRECAGAAPMRVVAEVRAQLEMQQEQAAQLERRAVQQERVIREQERLITRQAGDVRRLREGLERHVQDALGLSSRQQAVIAEQDNTISRLQQEVARLKQCCGIEDRKRKREDGGHRLRGILGKRIRLEKKRVDCPEEVVPEEVAAKWSKGGDGSGSK